MRKISLLIVFLNLFLPAWANEIKPAKTFEEVKRCAYGAYLGSCIQSGMSMFLMKHYQSAAEDLLKAVNVASQIGSDDKALDLSLSLLGSAYEHLGKYAESEKAYEEALDVEKRANLSTDQTMNSLEKAHEARESAKLEPLKDSILAMAQKTAIDDILFNPTPGYTNLLSDAVAKSWHPPTQLTETGSTVHFTIRLDGSFSDIKLTQASGQLDFDQAALDAITKASPLPPPEPGVKSVSVSFHFNKRYPGQMTLTINAPFLPTSTQGSPNKH